MKFLDKLRRDLANDRETLKRLPFRQKIRFLIDYYRGRAFLLLCLCLALFYIGDAVLEMNRETVLEGFFSNDDENDFPARQITKEFSPLLGLSPRQQVIFDDTLYVVPGSSADLYAASQGKIVAYVSARELDFLVTTEELMKSYVPSFPICDLDELLPADLLTRLEGQIYYANDGSGTYKACGVSMKNSRFRSSHYLMVFSYTKHRENMVRFLEWAFETDG